MLSIPQIAIVVMDNFSPFHYSVPSIIFDEKIAKQKFVELIYCAEKRGLCRTPSGFAIRATHSFKALPKADMVIIPYWHNIEERPSEQLVSALCTVRKKNIPIVGLCLGSVALGYAGLLVGKRVSTHWEVEQEFAKRFPEAKLDINALYVEDDGIITSAGTGAAIDCCLHIIRKQFGSEFANHIARRMVVPPHREGGQSQFIEHSVPQTTRDNQINDLLDFLKQHLAQEHNIDDLAERVMMSRSTFTRHFRKATGMSVNEWLKIERLHQSQLLLETSDLSIEKVALQAGFQSAITFRQQFKAMFNISPLQWRKVFKV